MKRFKHIVFLLVAVLALSSCDLAKIKDISLTSVGISYIVPTSTRSFDGKLDLVINNPSISFTVQEITGTLRYKDKPIAHFSTGSLELQGKSEQPYTLPCTVNLAEGASMLDILVIASQRNLNSLKADVDLQAALKKNGALRAPFSFKDLELTQFTK